VNNGMALCKALVSSTQLHMHVTLRGPQSLALYSKRSKLFENETLCSTVNVGVNIMWQLGFKIPIPSKNFWLEMFKLHFTLLSTNNKTSCLNSNTVSGLMSTSLHIYENIMFTNKENAA
jgi:hypothetical protein